jgi:glycosyltransferase involved in cell wall biosynthesis
MRLLLLSDVNSIHTKKWVKALSLRGCDVLVFGLGAKTDDFYKTLGNVKVITADFTGQYGRSSIGKLKYLKTIRFLKKEARKFKPEIIHSHYATSYGLLGALLKMKPFVVSVWGEDAFSFPKESAVKKKLFKWILNKTNCVFSTSEIMAKETRPYTKREVHVVPFGVDLSVFKKLKESEEEKDFFEIGIIKTLEEKYGISYLIDAFKIIINEVTDRTLKLRIVGAGRIEKQLKEQVKELNLEENVIFEGKIPHDEVPVYFNQMDIVVVPSILDGESFGVAAVEASACERPVVVSRIGGLQEVVIDKQTGFLVEPKNSRELADKIIMLMNDPKLRELFGKNGRQNVVEKYDWEKNADLMLSHYEEILRSNQ